MERHLSCTRLHGTKTKRRRMVKLWLSKRSRTFSRMRFMHTESSERCDSFVFLRVTTILLKWKPSCVLQTPRASMTWTLWLSTAPRIWLMSSGSMHRLWTLITSSTWSMRLEKGCFSCTQKVWSIVTWSLWTSWWTTTGTSRSVTSDSPMCNVETLTRTTTSPSMSPPGTTEPQNSTSILSPTTLLLSTCGLLVASLPSSLTRLFLLKQEPRKSTLSSWSLSLECQVRKFKPMKFETRIS